VLCLENRLWIMVGDGFRWLEMVEIVADGWLMMVGDVLKQGNGCVARTDKKENFLICKEMLKGLGAKSFLYQNVFEVIFAE
jgi:hypothetical protein